MTRPLPPAWAWEIIEQTGRAFAVTPHDIRRRGKSGGHLARARFAAAWLLRSRPMAHRFDAHGKHMVRSYSEIARLLGRDHTTIMNACRRAMEVAAEDPAYAAALAELATGHGAPVPRKPLNPDVPGKRKTKDDEIDWLLSRRVVAERNSLDDDDADAVARMRGTVALRRAIERELAA